MALHPAFVTTPVGMAIGLALTRVLKRNPKWYHYLMGGGLGGGAGYAAGEALHRLPAPPEKKTPEEAAEVEGETAEGKKVRREVTHEQQVAEAESQKLNTEWRRALAEKAKEKFIAAHPEMLPEQASAQYAQEEQSSRKKFIEDAIRHGMDPGEREGLWQERHTFDPRTRKWKQFRKELPIQTLPQKFQRALIAYQRQGGLDPYKLLEKWYPADKPYLGAFLPRIYAETPQEKLRSFSIKQLFPKSILNIGSPMPKSFERALTAHPSWWKNEPETVQYGGAIPKSSAPPFKK